LLSEESSEILFIWARRVWVGLILLLTSHTCGINGKDVKDFIGSPK